MRYTSVKLTLIALFAALMLLPEAADAGPFRRRDRGAYDSGYTVNSCDCGGGSYGSGMGYGYRGGPSYYSYSTPYYYGSNMAFGAPLGNAEAGNIPTTNLPGGTSSSYYTPGGATASGATRMPGETTRIRFTDSQLDPPVVNLTVGMTVRWMNDSLRPQTVTSVNNDFDSGEILPGKEFVATFNRPGTFEYTSKNQKDFKGRIVVNPQR